MNYGKRTIWEKRLPGFLGVFVLLFTLATTIWLSSNTVLFVTKATVGSVPKEIQITNITASSVTIAYLTDENATGAISYGPTDLMGEIALDENDEATGKPNEVRTHFITLKDLQPNTKYYFEIASGTQVATNNGSPYEVTTAAEGGAPVDANPTISGSVALDDGTIPAEAIAYIETADSQKLATRVKPDGTYSIPLAELRSKDLSTVVTLTPQTQLGLLIVSPTQQSKAKLLVNKDGQVPKIVLGKDYDFALSPDPAAAPLASDSAKPASGSATFPLFDEIVPVTSPEITTPKEDQQFKDTQPLFKGKALPNTEIQLEIHSPKDISATLQSDADGNWEFRPPVDLDPGAHTISISSVDAAGVLQKISASFTVNAQGSQFIEPSVSPIQATPTKEPPVTPTPAELPSLTPTETPIPTPSNLTPTVDPRTLTPAANGHVGPVGNSTLVNGIIGAVTAIGIGALLFIVTAI